MGGRVRQLLPGQHAERSAVSRLPIDRGWAWVVAAAACGIFGLPNGSHKIYGLIYVHMLEHFGSDPKLTFWVLAVAGPIALAAGPLISLMLKKTSHRFVTVTGSILAAAGAAATGYIPRMEAGFLTFSVVFGLGMTFLTLSSLTCTIPYFDHHRGLAVGLTSAGGGVMSFLLPVVMAAVFETYTFGGAMLIYAGLLLQTAVLGCLLRPFSMYSERRKKPLARTVARRILANETQRSDADECINGLSFASDRQQKCGADVEQPADAPKLQPPGCERGVAHSEQLGRGGAACSPPAAATASGAASNFFDFSLLKNERMWMIGMIGLFAVNGMAIVFTVMPPHGDAIGLPRATTSMLIAIGGALEIFGRALQGWFSDRHVMPILTQLGLCTGLTGISAVLCPIIGGAAGVGLLAALCGAGGTSVISLTTVVMRELLGAEKVTSAMGIQSLFYASSYILSTIAAVYMMEAYGSWNYVFYYIGGNLMMSSVLCMGYALVLKMREERKAFNS